jgi:hypothetical protein
MLKPLFIALLLPACAPAMAGGSTALEKAAAAAAAQIAEKPAGLEELFAPEFFRQVSLAQISDALSGVYRDNGAVTKVIPEKEDSASSGHFVFETDNSYVPAALSVNRDSGRITGLYFGAARRRDPELKKAAAALAALPGRAGLEAVRLAPEPETLEAMNADGEFAVSSLFKLYVLGALLKEKISWDKVFTLDERDRSLPPGKMADWPAGAPATVYSLALAMIADSDNTATDTLISGIGRRNIEAALVPLGHSAPALLKPFLRTSEMFRLRADTGAALKYMNLPAVEKYGFLDKLREVPLDEASARPSPFGLASAEWQASPCDICRLLSWLLSRNDQRVLGLLAAAPAPGAPLKKFVYAGYKGGGEPGIIAGAWLLRDKAGSWFCLSAVWNDADGRTDGAEFLKIMSGAADSLSGR